MQHRVLLLLLQISPIEHWVEPFILKFGLVRTGRVPVQRANILRPIPLTKLTQTSIFETKKCSKHVLEHSPRLPRMNILQMLV